jgi:hypothetical protein
MRRELAARMSVNFILDPPTVLLEAIVDAAPLLRPIVLHPPRRRAAPPAVPTGAVDVPATVVVVLLPNAMDHQILKSTQNSRNSWRMLDMIADR